MRSLDRKTDTAGLCVLHAEDASVERTGCFREYIAFGDWTNGENGPSIWFHGGTPFSGKLENAPQMCFNVYGDWYVTQAAWMNCDTCPNLFREEYLAQLTAFVQSNLPILYLVYERYLDKEDALAYFTGKTDWETMLSCVYRIDDDLYAGLVSCRNNAQLHTFCIGAQIYGKMEVCGNRSILCKRLERQLHPVFTLSWDGTGGTLQKYNGNAECVRIPEDINVIGEGAFADQKQIRKLLFSGDVQIIEAGAFRGCNGIEMLTLPPDVGEIGENAFAYCSKLHTVCFSGCDQDVYLDNGAFRGCKKLSDIYLPPGVFLEGDPFEACPNLKIHCKAGSWAEAYAKEYDVPYKCVEGK